MELKAVERTCSDVETEGTTMIDGTTKVKHHRFKDRLSKDANFRMKCIIWICLCWSFIVLVSFFLFWFFVVLVIKNYMLVLCCFGNKKLYVGPLFFSPFTLGLCL